MGTNNSQTNTMSPPDRMTYLLYVDDEPDLLELTRRYLERTGEFIVVTCSSAREALRSPCIERCDAIVSDYQMPEMDGIEFLKAVRERRTDVPFILFTGRGREDVVIEAINNGADYYLQKGGDPRAQFAELVHQVRQALGRRRMETALSEAEKRLADIIDFLPDATFAIDREGRVIAWNRAVEELTGVMADEVIGRGEYAHAVPFYGERRPILIDLVLDPSLAVEGGYEHVIRRGDVLIADTTLPRPRGRPTVLRGTASPLYDRDGAVVGAIESVRDISDLKRVESELRVSEEKYRLAAELSALVVYDADLSTGNRDVAGAVREVLGLAPGEESALGEMAGWMARIHPDDLPGVLAAIGGPDAPSPRYSVEYRFRARDGTWIPIEDTGGVLVDGTGRPARRIGTLRNLTQRKEQEAALRTARERLQAAHDELVAVEADLRRQVEALRTSERQASENEARFRAIFEHSPYSIAITGPTGAYLLVNQAFERDSGYTAADVIGRTPVEIGLMPQNVYVQIGEELLRRGRVEQFPFTSRRADGAEGYALLSAIRITYDHQPAVMAIVIDITAQKRAEQTIREKNEEIDRFFSMSLDLFCIADTNGRFLRLNREWEAALGYTVEELEGARFRDFVHPDDRETWLEAFTILGEERPVFNVTNRFRHRNGSYRWIEWRLMPLGGRIYASARDVTDRHEATARTLRIGALKQELIRSAPLEERLERITGTIVELFGAVYAGVWLPGPGDLCTRGCDRGCPAKGPCLHLVAGSGACEPAARGLLRVPPGVQTIGRIADGGSPELLVQEIPAEPRCDDREWAAFPGPAVLTGIRLSDTDSPPFGVLAVLTRQPVSASEEAFLRDLADTASQVVRTGTIERALRQSEEQYRSIIENVKEGYLRSDAEGRVVLANPSAAGILGYDSPHDLMGLPAVRLYPSAESRAALYEQIQRNDHVRDCEIEMVRRDGSVIWVSVNAHRLRDEDGSFAGIEGFLRDITERRRMETAVREANRKLNLLNSITRHDLANQLTALEGVVNLAAADPASPRTAKYLEMARSTVRTIARQLEFTKTYQELGVRSPAWVNLGSLDDGPTPIPVIFDERCREWEIFADPMVTLVMANLVDNAVRHGERVTHVEIGCEEQEGGLVITVRDDGVGIPREEKERIFEKGVGRNTGLGLFLVREILGITGITIRETGVPEEGACFEIRVPADACRRAAVPA